MLRSDAVRDWCIGACCGADQLQKMSDCYVTADRKKCSNVGCHPMRSCFAVQIIVSPARHCIVAKSGVGEHAKIGQLW